MKQSKHGGSRAGAGRPAGSVNQATIEVREIASQWGPAAIRRAAGMAGLIHGTDGQPIGAAASEAAQIAALEIVLNRAYGRPSQSLTHNLGIETLDLAALLRSRRLTCTKAQSKRDTD